MVNNWVRVPLWVLYSDNNTMFAFFKIATSEGSISAITTPFKLVHVVQCALEYRFFIHFPRDDRISVSQAR